MKDHLRIGDHPIPVDELARVMVSREPAILADGVALVPATVLLTVDLTYGEFTEIRHRTPQWAEMVAQLTEIFPGRWPDGPAAFEDAARGLADGEFRTLWER